MANYTKYQCFVEDVAEKVHNLATDTLKVALTNNSPNAATHKVLADIGEITAGNGYAAGGYQAAQASSGQSAGLYALALTDPATWVATGGPIGPFRYAVLYNDTAPSKPLICYWDYGASITLNVQETYKVDLASQTLTIG